MKQNIYDNELFYNSYADLRARSAGLNDVLEIPAFRSLLPDLKDKDILDLGCGFGESCKWYAAQGARRIVGIDISERMIFRAGQDFKDNKIDYICVPMEEADFPAREFDVVLSSLAFHYVKDYGALLKRINQWLRPGGFLLFSQEHPIATAKKIAEGWIRDESGEKMHWILDNYGEEGLREHNWFVNGVIKYHRTIATVINTLIDSGFKIVRLSEPTATVEAESLNGELRNERRRPPFLIIKAQKQQ